MINRNVFNKIFGVLHRIEDFITSICTKVNYIFYIITVQNHQSRISYRPLGVFRCILPCISYAT